jgi:acetyl-CoA carboxylase biotin carboxylase subunit
MFNKILIANRGEIAVRIERSCREMGIAAVAVYSDVDRAALHVRKADEAYWLGEAPASGSYLSIPKLLDAAQRSGAEAIHPGYGFLSENPRFARACEAAGIKFIGPTAAAMELMGSKTRARQTMQKVAVPAVPGSSHGLTSLDDARRVAAEVGYPIMLKATAGGGGKGMRMVHGEAELLTAMVGAQSEAQRAFGDSEIYIEKAIERPRHIEVQIFADEHGNTVYLGERECSVQRRHQKVVEESPSPLVGDDADMRRRMGETAVLVARAAGYTNAGTVEFLVDSDRKFYFLEMNTRLQVEHPVTELVTGLDLVQLQIRVAAGEPLGFTQQDVSIRGHAIECRIYAEDPDNNFFPSPGKITRLVSPAGPGIREDSGIYEGWTVPLDYDPLLSKLVGYGATRAQAIARLRRALDEYFVGGIKSNVPLLRRILRDQEFIAGQLDTGYLDRLLSHRADGSAIERHGAGDEHLAEVAAIAAAIFSASEMAANSSIAGTSNGSGKMARFRQPSTSLSSESSWKKTGREEGLR